MGDGCEHSFAQQKEAERQEKEKRAEERKSRAKSKYNWSTAPAAQESTSDDDWLENWKKGNG